MSRELRSNASSLRRVRARARVLLAAAIAAGFAAAPASAGIERAGTTAANFLSVGSGAGVLGMGGAGLGLEGGLAAAAWNPATLARLGGTEVVFSHAGLGEQTAQEWAGLAGRLRFAGLSGAVTGLFQSEGSFEGRDALNNPTGTFDVSSGALGFGIARAFGPFVSAGIGLKYASENLGAVRGSGVAFDAGLQVRAGSFGFGAAAQNALGTMKYDAASYDFPSSYGLGVSYAHAASGLRFALDMNFPPAYYRDVRGGVEWRWNERIALRTGYRAELGAAAGEPLGGPTFGMGAGARGMWLDYGYLVGGTGTGQHRLGITFHPGAMALPGDEPVPGGRGPGYSSGGSVAGQDGGASASGSARPGTGAPSASSSGAGAPKSTAATPSTGLPASAQAPAPASSSALPSPRRSASASVPSSPRASAGATKSPGPGVPASASVPPSPRVSASPLASASAAGPVAARIPSSPSAPPPTYTQRARAARGTSEAAASDRKTAAASPSSGATPRPPAAPLASVTPPATTRRDSTAAKASPAGAAGSTAGTAPTAGAANKPDSAAARPGAASGVGTTPSAPGIPASQERAENASRPEKVKVKSGQTMADIARTYRTSVPAIMMENNLVSDRVRPGQVLKLPPK